MAEKKEKKDNIKIVDINTYMSQVPADIGNGSPRRVAALQKMFDDLGGANYLTQIEWKGETYFVFKG